MNTEIMTPSEQHRFDQYTDSLRVRGRKDRTIESYQSAHREFCKHWMQLEGRPMDVTTISGLDLRQWKATMLNAKLAPTTVNVRLIGVKSYIRWALDMHIIPRERTVNALDVSEVPITRLGASPLDPDTLRRFLRAVETHATLRDQAIVALLMNGLRLSEVAGLRVADISINAHRGTVTLQGIHIKRSAHREVPLTRQTRTTLKAYLENIRPQNHVFIGERGPLTDAGVYKVIKNISHIAGCDVHPHALRHAFSLRYLAANQNDLAGLRLLLGHSNIQTTAAHYANKSLEDLRGGVQRIGD